MEIPITDGEQFHGLLMALIREVCSANDHYKLLVDLSKARKSCPFAFQQSPTFWYLTTRSHFDAMAMRLSKAYDKRKQDDTLTLTNFLLTVKTNITIFDDSNFAKRLIDNHYLSDQLSERKFPSIKVIENDLKSVAKDNRHVVNLLKWRDKYFSHLGVEPIIGGLQLDIDYPLFWNDLRTLIKRGIRILNRYSYMFNASVTASTLVGHDDYKNLLKAIKYHLKAKRIEYSIAKV